jgi:signal transduction histidine kinase
MKEVTPDQMGRSVDPTIAKHPRYDSDSVINRIVVLGLIAAFIAVIYVFIVVGMGALLGESSDSLVLPIVATAVVALAFEPVRDRAQKWANRLVYGRRSTPYEVLSKLTERLADSESGEGILLRIAGLLKDGTGADRATVWLGEPGSMSPVATWPEGAAPEPDFPIDDRSMFSVTHDGSVIGALEVVKPGGMVLSTVERNLVSDLAGSVGLVLGYERLNESLAERAREVDDSRHRLVEAQDDERRRLERDLHDGAQQQLVALKVKIGIAKQLAAKRGASDLETLLDTLGDEAQLALEEIRSLAKGIYPPVLESDGLSAAISSLASGMPVQVVVGSNGVGRYPAEVEAAIYFNISEAVTNAIKYGSPPIQIDIYDREGLLRFEVKDAGEGFDVEAMTAGSGMNNMADRLDALGGRLDVASGPGSGTVVRGEIPIAVGDPVSVT